MSKNQRNNLLLWTAQALLAALFLFAMAAGAIVPLVVGVISALIAYGRREWAPLA
jgi:hypothetical protein